MSSQNLSVAFIGALALISLSLPSTALSQGAFLRNLQPLDNEIRGYCLDVRRAPPNVDLEGRLGTHACKYGLENVDQQFEWRAPDQIYLPEYDRCLTAAGFDVGADPEDASENRSPTSATICRAGLRSPPSATSSAPTYR